MKMKLLIFFMLASSVAAAISPLDPMASAILTSDSATKNNENSIDVPVGAQLKLAYQENSASLTTIVRWRVSVAPVKGIDLLYTEEFMGGYITRFLTKNPGNFTIKLEALDDSQIIRSREFTVNVTTAPLTSEDTNLNVFADSTMSTDVQQNNSADDNTMNRQNSSMNSTNVSDSSYSEGTKKTAYSSSNDGSVGAFISVILVLIPALFIMRKKGVV